MPAPLEKASEFQVEAALLPARALVRQRDYCGALAVLAELERQHPRSGLLWQERAACYGALHQQAQALTAYRRAVELNDALQVSWAGLRDLARAAGLTTEAQHASACLARLSSLPPPLLTGSSLLSEGELDAAERVIRDYLRTHGAHLEGMRLLAQIAVKRYVLDDAELLLENILERAPDYHEARQEYVFVLTQRRRYHRALVQANRLLQVAPQYRPYRLAYARACDGLGDWVRALEAYRQLLAETPQDAELELAIAALLKTHGDAAQAIAAFRAAGESPAGYAEASFGLANMKTYRFREAEIDRMRAVESDAAVSVVDRYRLCFALGKALEDRAAYADSFGYYQRGNALKKSELRYSPAATEENMRLQAQFFTQDFLARRQGFGCTRADPIFIVGLPRSGSTLLEQILASHSRVDGTLELPDIPRLVQRFRNRSTDVAPRYPAVLGELEARDLRELGEEYLEETRAHRQGAPFFIDKLPGNFRDIGFIQLILPNARIIDARREPMACCFGNFKQLFINGQEFSYDLEDLGRYYHNYVELMAHWDRVLPGKVLRVNHRDVVDDLEGSVRRMLAFCGLDFESSCLEFYKTARGVRTVSSEQVRRPIYRESLDQWRHYEPWLGPLKSALGDLAQVPPAAAG